MKITILGSGCSTGVPRADGYWGNCDPSNPKNQRSRCSAWVEIISEQSVDPNLSLLIDTSPDFRQQAILNGISHLDSILWTHDHADQTHGIDDFRAFTFNHGPVDGYMDEVTFTTLSHRFPYIFQGIHGYPAICVPHILHNHPGCFEISKHGVDVKIRTFDQIHGPIKSVGYRIGDFAYSSDISDLPSDSFEALKDLKLWVVDALRYKPHPTHAHLDKALEWIDIVKPQHAILTNLHQDMDYEELKSILPDHVEPAFDGLSRII